MTRTAKPGSGRWRRAGLTLRILVTAGLLLAIFARIRLGDVLANLRTIHLGLLFVGIICYSAGRLSAAWQMQRLARQVGLPFTLGQILMVNFSAAFYELSLPGYVTGGAVRWMRFAQPGNQWGEVLAVIVFNRFLDLLTLTAIGTAFWVLNAAAGANAAAGVGLLTIFVALALVHLELKHGWIGARISASWPARVARQLPLTVRDKAQTLWQLARAAYRQYRLGTKAALPTIAIAVLRHVLGMAAFGLFAAALGIELTWLQVGWVRSVVFVLAMLPVTISGLGVREGSLVLLLAPYGVPAAPAVALSLLLYGQGLLYGAFGGLLELVEACGGSKRFRRAKVVSP